MQPSRLVQFLCSVGVVALAACSQQSVSPSGPSALDSPAAASPSDTSAQAERVTIASAPAPNPSVANSEVKFMTDMIDHHMMAVMMADVCLNKAVHAELRTMCDSIKSAQLAEITQMQTWLQQWYRVTYEPAMEPGDHKMIDRLAASGAEFEIEFMEMMIKHHTKAIKEGQHCLDKAVHAELRALCQNIIATQSDEIAQMEAWLCQWYGECR